MLTVFLFALAGGVLGFSVMRPYNNGLGTIMLGLAAGMLGFVVSSLILGGALADKSDFERKTKTFQLVSLDNSVNASGQFFLGSGSIQGEKRYFYMTETEKGIASRSVDASDAYIVETDTTSPKIVRHKFDGKPQPWYFPSSKVSDAVENHYRI